ncbi:hypothetical protein QTG54_000959 [Skeletonema marinoi]|uniref:Plastid lipid-associated protein/fibrillin conserved domain-containing protein n=1 Tax=Skeletonema marinoi TaxID=267567 RepID=A0AAD8YP38_9STRA|nr:hypothetical protein QTG54_000959 [Skeletonema marinoi]
MTPIRSMLSFVGGTVVLSQLFLSGHSFSNTKQPTQRTSSRVLMHMAPPSKTMSVAELEAESEQLRIEIEELRKEALSRLEALSEQLGVVETEPSKPLSTTQTGDDKDLLPAPMPITFTDSTTSSKKSTKGIANLLDETTWKISLSIGREPGTWMPKDWGKSGQRLNLSFTADFTPSQLFDRDDFFRGGYTNAKILNVESNQITLGPSLSEGQRSYKVKNGGWQVTRGDGPMGTDLLRFFIEVDEEITHAGSDVYIPKGRIYCSCGYFPFMNNGGKDGMKDAVKDEIKKIEGEIMQLQKKKDEIKNPFNLDGIKISSEIFKLKQDLDQLNQRLSFAMVRQPDKQLLRYSPDGDVGLTKEGGVCCEVKKGPVVEYHILGRFGVVSAQKEEK